MDEGEGAAFLRRILFESLVIVLVLADLGLHLALSLRQKVLAFSHVGHLLTLFCPLKAILLHICDFSK